MSTQSSDDQILDGYRLIRFLGRGGFGDVWLCRSEAMGDYRALKWIPATNADRLEKEYESLLHYRTAAARLRSPHLVPIEHVNRNEAGLYYVMPLADGIAGNDPSDPDWQPLSLAAKIHAQTHKPQWFTSREILALIGPVLQALQTLSDAGLVHRDVKPDNILFFNGQPCLGDISLLGVDASVITRRGTTGYVAPSWYLGGHPDMYGAAATLYTLLTGNLPDKMGRSAFLWPPQGENSLSETERAEWKRLHRIICRASEEIVSERFLDFHTMAAAFGRETTVANTGSPRSSFSVGGWIALVLVLIGITLVLWSANQSAASDPEPGPQGSPTVETNTPPPVAHETLVAPTPTKTERRSTAANTSAPSTRPAAASSRAAHPMPKVKRSLQDPKNGSHGVEDSKLACNNLEWIASEQGLMSKAELEVFRDMLQKIQICIRDPQTPDYKAAARFLDEGVNAIPTLKNRGNIKLARLVLLQCDGQQTLVDRESSDPSLLVLGDDNLSYRIELLSRTRNHDIARQLLDNIVVSSTASRRERSQALMERARLRAGLGDNQGAFSDAGLSFELAEGDPAEKSARKAEHDELQKDDSGYAEFVKSQPEI